MDLPAKNCGRSKKEKRRPLRISLLGNNGSTLQDWVKSKGYDTYLDVFEQGTKSAGRWIDIRDVLWLRLEKLFSAPRVAAQHSKDVELERGALGYEVGFPKVNRSQREVIQGASPGYHNSSHWSFTWDWPEK